MFYWGIALFILSIATWVARLVTNAPGSDAVSLVMTITLAVLSLVVLVTAYARWNRQRGSPA